jgi:subtilisin family serine protease
VAFSYTSQSALARALSVQPVRLVHVIPPLRVAEVRPLGSVPAYIDAVSHLPGVRRVARTVPRAAAMDPALTLGQVSTPGGGAYEWQYYVTHMDLVPSAVLAAARRVTIAVIDTGADVRSPDLSAKIASSYDVRSGSSTVDDRIGHGTFVASLAAGGAEDGGEVVGFGGSARLLIVKVGDSTTFSDVDVAAGIVYAVRHGARVINLSVAGRTRSLVEKAALAYAARHRVVVVAAAGNDALDGNPPEYPAALLQPLGSNGVGGSGLAVAASDMSGARARFSEHGSYLSLAAPGAAVLGMIPAGTAAGSFAPAQLPGASDGVYAYASGTSFAAPEVAGAAALVLAANPRLSATQVASILKETASGRGSWNPELGFGVLDVAAAVERAASTPA